MRHASTSIWRGTRLYQMTVPVLLFLSYSTSLPALVAPGFISKNSSARRPRLLPSWQSTMIPRNSWSGDFVRPSADQTDAKAVLKQLGHLPENFVAVSAWTADRSIPVAIQTYPLEGGAPRRRTKAKLGWQQHRQEEDALTDSRNVTTIEPIGTPFPTLYWLTHPAINKAIGEMERRGYVQLIQKELTDRQQLQLLKAHAEYAEARWLSLTPSDRTRLSDTSDKSVRRIRDMLKYSGIAGTNITSGHVPDFQAAVPSLKCLHTHYAHFRSTKDTNFTSNPVGFRVHELLKAEFPHVFL